MKACERCGTTAQETAWSDGEGMTLCLRCYTSAEQPEDSLAIALRLAIPQCAQCGENLGARYRAVNGQLVCWACLDMELDPPAKKVNKTWVPVEEITDPRERYKRFVDKVLMALDRLCVYEPIHVGDGHTVLSYCPVCGQGVVALTFYMVDDEPRLKVSSDRGNSCSLGCSKRLIGDALFR